MRLRVALDADELARWGAEEVSSAASEALRERGVFTLALSGGSTPDRMHRLLGKGDPRFPVPWGETHLFWSDERGVPPDSPDSNFAGAYRALIQPLGLEPSRVHRMRGEEADPEAAARAYEDELARVLGAPRCGPPPPLDLILLGMGTDGHTASLFPGSYALRESSRWVLPTTSPAGPPQRLSMTFRILNAARRVAVLVAGSEKAPVLARVLARDRALPLSHVAPREGSLLFLADRAAASTLPPHLTQSGEPW